MVFKKKGSKKGEYYILDSKKKGLVFHPSQTQIDNMRKKGYTFSLLP